MRDDRERLRDILDAAEKRQITGMRHRVVHDYFAVDRDVLAAPPNTLGPGST